MQFKLGDIAIDAQSHNCDNNHDMNMKDKIKPPWVGTDEKSKAYLVWWYLDSANAHASNEQGFSAGWDAALAKRPAESTSEIKIKLRAEAVTAFLEGRDEAARLARSLLNRFESWDK